MMRRRRARLAFDIMRQAADGTIAPETAERKVREIVRLPVSFKSFQFVPWIVRGQKAD